MVSVVLHAVNTLVLFLLLGGMTGHVWRSACVAALFGIHPLHVESVAWIAERKDVLSTLFWLLATWGVHAVCLHADAFAVRARRRAVRPRAHVEADGGHAPVHAAVARLVAAQSGEIRGDGGRPGPVLQHQAMAAAGGREVAPVRDVGALRRDNGCRPAPGRSGGDAGGDPGVHAARKRGAVIRDVRVAYGVAFGVERLLSACRNGPGSRDRRRSGVCRRRLDRGRSIRPRPAACDVRVALVSRNTRAGHRTRASRHAGEGRPVHVRAAHRPLRGDRVGMRRARGRATRAANGNLPGCVRSHRRLRCQGPCAGRVLGRRCDAVGAGARGAPRQLLCALQPRPGRPAERPTRRRDGAS